MSNTEPTLSGKVVFITGAGTGVGRALALGLKGHSATVVTAIRDVQGRNSAIAQELVELGIGAVECDVTNDDSVTTAVETTAAKYGQIDVVINNAGIAVSGATEAATLDDLRDSFETNVYGPHRVVRAALPAMRARGDGLIIQISSSAGRWVQPGNGIYSASKWALEAMSEAMRWELGEFGVDCTVVELGSFQSELAQSKARSVSDHERASAYQSLTRAKTADHDARFLGQNASAASPDEIVAPVVNLICTPRGERPFRLVLHAYKAALDRYNDMQTALSAAVFQKRGYAEFVQNGLVFTSPEGQAEVSLE